MADTPVTRGTLPLTRLVVLAVAVLVGLILFLVLSRTTPVVVEPVGVEARP